MTNCSKDQPKGAEKGAVPIQAGHFSTYSIKGELGTSKIGEAGSPDMGQAGSPVQALLRSPLEARAFKAFQRWVEWMGEEPSLDLFSAFMDGYKEAVEDIEGGGHAVCGCGGPESLRACRGCGGSWQGLHCPHDPCPYCGVYPVEQER